MVESRTSRSLWLAYLCPWPVHQSACYYILSELYSKHNAESRRVDDHAPKHRLNDMLRLPLQRTIYIIVRTRGKWPLTRDHATQSDVMQVRSRLEVAIPVQIPEQITSTTAEREGTSLTVQAKETL